MHGDFGVSYTYGVPVRELIADRLAVVEGGRVVSEGAAVDLLTRPRTPFLARLCGTNLIAGTAVADGGLEIAPGVVLRGVADEEPLNAGDVMDILNEASVRWAEDRVPFWSFLLLPAVQLETMED